MATINVEITALRGKISTKFDIETTIQEIRNHYGLGPLTTERNVIPDTYTIEKVIGKEKQIPAEIRFYETIAVMGG